MDRRRFFIVGPTASGKGRLAVEVALLAGGEVVSVDSMKVYRGMDIGTAKPPPERRRGARFHLLDIRDPAEPMSVAGFIREAEAAEADILARGRLPVFEGGTALYVKGLTEGVFAGPPADRALRERLLDVARREGNEALHARLAAVDPTTYNRLHPNDLRRVVRALEVFEKTGRPISAFQGQWADWPAGAGGGERLDEVRRHRVLVGLRRPREALYRRIEERVDRMVAAGWVEEARRILERPEGIGREAEQALGYRELFRWLRAGGDPAALPAAIGKIRRDTRRFARRQLTFLRHFPDIDWRDVNEGTDPHVLASEIVRQYGLRAGPPCVEDER